MGQLDFKGLNERIMDRILELLAEFCPGGKRRGVEYCAANINGSPGGSFSFNTETGLWSDFSTGQSGKDFIALYAAQRAIDMGRAYKELADHIGFQDFPDVVPTRRTNVPSPKPVEPRAAPIPVPTAPSEPPDFKHPVFGEPVAHWTYRDESGNVLFHVARYEPPDSRKQIVPWSWDGERWQMKSLPAPRPLFNLDKIAQSPSGKVLVVEGEKAAVACEQLTNRIVTTWPNGGASWKKANFEPLRGRVVTLWPDADAPGIKCMNALGDYLQTLGCDVTILRVETDGGGFDAADALAKGWTHADLAKFAAPISFKMDMKKPAPKPESRPEPRVEPKQPEPPQEDEEPPHPAELVLVPEVMPPEYFDPPAAVDIRITDERREPLPASLMAFFEDNGILVKPKQNEPRPTMSNVLRFLGGFPGLRDSLWYDEFYQQRRTTWLSENGQTTHWEERHDRELCALLQDEFAFHGITPHVIEAATWTFALRRKRSEPQEWISSLTWDGTPRIEQFFTTHMGAVDNPYMRAISMNFWVSMVARALEPGCKADCAVILEGPQGGKKSQACAAIGGKWHCECNAPASDKDFLMSMRGRLLIEIAELDSFARTDPATVKKVLTCREDVFRPPYGREVVSHPRRCVFIGTTNQSEYLFDETGARRFWPVAVSDIKIPEIKRDREQLFAEAYHAFKAGVSWWETPTEETKAEQEARYIDDVWHPVVKAYLQGRTRVTIHEIATDALKIDLGRIDRKVSVRIGKILRRINFFPKVVFNGTSSVKMFCRDGIADGVSPARIVQTSVPLDSAEA